MQKFKIDIWFDNIPHKILLSSVWVYAETEEEALKLAKHHTDYQVSGVDDVTWQVREPLAQYSI